MTDAVIKAALEVAAKAACKAQNYGCGGECSQCLASSAAAIAAFHLALGEDGEMHARSIGLQTFKTLAAAVERAAGGGDG